MSEVPRRTCETTSNSTTGQVETVITVETSPPMRALAWMNFLKQRLYILQLDYRQVAAERIVFASRPETADSVTQLVESATEIADQYLNSRREPLLNR